MTTNTNGYGWLFLFCWIAARSFAGAWIIPDPTVQAAHVVQERTQGLVRAGKGVTEVPWQLGQCLRLPLGLAEVLFSPLPGVEFKTGLEDLGVGVLAPFKFGVALFEMPREVYCGFADTLKE